MQLLCFAQHVAQYNVSACNVLLHVHSNSILDYMIREPDHDFTEVVVQRFSIIHAGKLHNYQTTLRETGYSILNGGPTIPRSYKRENNCRGQRGSCTSLRLSRRQAHHLREECYTPISDLSIYQNKDTVMMGKRYPEAGKREGVDGGLNKSRTFKRRSSKVLSAKRDSGPFEEHPR